MSIRMGAFDDDPGVRPSWRTFVAYAAPWEPIPDDGLGALPAGESALTRSYRPRYCGPAGSALPSRRTGSRRA